MLKLYIKKILSIRIFLVSILITVIIILISVFVGEKFSNQMRVIDLLESSNYDYVTIMSNDSPEENIYEFYDNNLKFYTNRSANDLSNNINTKLYSLIDDKEYNERSPFHESNLIKGEINGLERNEIAITENIANNYNIQVGSMLYSRIDNKVEVFEVKAIYKENYGFYNIDVNQKQGSILMSASFQLGDILEKKYIFFPNLSIDNNYFYEDFFSKKYEINELKKGLYFSFSLIILFFILLILLLQLISNISFKKELRSFEMLGINKKEKMSVVLVKDLIVFGIPLLISLILTVTNIFNGVFIISIMIVVLFNSINYGREHA